MNNPVSDIALREAAERLLRNQRETFEYPPGAGYYDDTADLELVCGAIKREHSAAVQIGNAVNNIMDSLNEAEVFSEIPHGEAAVGARVVFKLSQEKATELLSHVRSAKEMASALSIPLKETQVSQ